MAQMFKIDNTEYTTNEAGTYFYKTGTNGKKWRIAKCEYEQAFEEYVNQKTDEAEAWEDEMREAKEEAAQKQAESDKIAEDTMNGDRCGDGTPSSEVGKQIMRQAQDKAKKASKPRKSKDVAYDGNGVTLTAKQVDFLKEMAKTSFYENGVESSLWCDVLTEEIGGQFAGKPMTVGAMISTLREKGLAVIGQERVNGRKAKFMEFTETGKKVLTDLGL